MPILGAVHIAQKLGVYPEVISDPDSVDYTVAAGTFLTNAIRKLWQRFD